jgi:hypothetical protein
MTLVCFASIGPSSARKYGEKGLPEMAKGPNIMMAEWSPTNFGMKSTM